VLLPYFFLFCMLIPDSSILRAIYEICLKRGWAAPTRAALEMCKMVEKRMFVPTLFTCLYLTLTLTSFLQVEFDDTVTTI
jgi:Sec63 Brl domain